jgi:hypothetical protein
MERFGQKIGKTVCKAVFLYQAIAFAFFAKTFAPLRATVFSRRGAKRKRRANGNNRFFYVQIQPKTPKTLFGL